MTEHRASDAQSQGMGEAFFPAQSSVLDESKLLESVVRQYPIGSIDSCRFLERGDSDIYRVKAGGADYYLKVHRPPDQRIHSESEARFVARLAEIGLGVVLAVPRTDGAFATEVVASEGPRPMLLFEEAPPPLPKEPPFELMPDLGAAIARVHALGDAEDEAYDLPSFDLQTIELERAPYIRTFATEEDSQFMDKVIEWIRPQLAAIPREAPEWGICHADLVLSNVREAEEGVTLFDFGGMARTYRGYDLTVVYWSLGGRVPDQRDKYWTNLLAGYESVRPLPEKLEERLPAFHALRELSFLGGNAATLPLRLGTEPFEPIESSFVHAGFERIRKILENAGASV